MFNKPPEHELYDLIVGRVTTKAVSDWEASHKVPTDWVLKDEIIKQFHASKGRQLLADENIPTIFSPDGKWLYLSSEEAVVPTDDPIALNIYFDSLIKGMNLMTDGNSWSFAWMHRVELDYLAVWKLLSDLKALPEGYKCPEYYLELVKRKLHYCVIYTNHIEKVRYASHEA